MDREEHLYQRAIGIIVQSGRASTILVQRELGIGYRAAARLMERAEADGVVLTPNHVGKREVIAMRQPTQDALSPSSRPFISPETPPEGLDRELLTILAEECCEVGQRVSKALRFGIAEIQEDQPFSNARRLADELGDVLGVADRLIERGVLNADEIAVARRAKGGKLDRFLQQGRSS